MRCHVIKFYFLVQRGMEEEEEEQKEKEKEK